MSEIHGTTSNGKLVHKRTWDFHNPKSFFNKINSKVGLKITLVVGTMWCAYLFAVLAFFALPSAIHQGTYYVIVWLSSSFLQLVLLPIIIVGQNIQATASDVRSTKTFEDAETILDRLDLNTIGGIRDLKDHLDARLNKLEKDK